MGRQCWQLYDEPTMEGPKDLRKPNALFGELLKARKQLAHGTFEEWLYAPIDGKPEAPETEEQAIEAQWAEEDLRLRLKIASGIAIVAAVIGMPVVSLFSTSSIVTIPFIWSIMNIPLLTLATITWRRRELRLGVKRPVKGLKARVLVVLTVLFSFLVYVIDAAFALLFR